MDAPPRFIGKLAVTPEQSRRERWWEDLRSDLRSARRTLARTPGFGAVAVLTLALGVGATVAIFTVVNAVLLRPLPYGDADRIVAIGHYAPGLTQTKLQSSTGLIAYYRESARTLTRMAGFKMRDVNIISGGVPARVRAVAVTRELFDVLSIRPERGRPFYESDAQQGAPRVALLTHATWRSRFGGDPEVVGRQIILDGQSVEIVGVLPSSVVFPDPSTSITPGFSGLREAQLWVPLWLDPKGIFGDFGISTVARLTPGVTVEVARLEMESLQHHISERFRIPPKLLEKWGWSVSVDPLRDHVVGDMSRPLWILFGTVGFVLLIAGANVANLFLVRAESRRRELGIMSALGASRARITRAFLTESLAIALLGGAVGLFTAAVGIRLLVAYGPAKLPRLHEVSVDGTVVVFALALSLLAGVVLGTVSMFRLPRVAFSGLAVDAGHGGTTGRQRHRLRHLLIVGQVALALVLLVGCGLMLRSVARLYTVHPGVRIEGLLTAGVGAGAQRDRTQTVTFYHNVLDEVAKLPGVASVGAANILPLEASGMNGTAINPESHPRVENEVRPLARYKAVTAGYFEALGMPLLEGRRPERADSELDRPVVWVNQAFVRQLLGNRTIGERFGIEGRTLEIVGVVGDVREFGLREDVRPTAYLPLRAIASVGLQEMYVVVRSTDAPPPSVSALRAAIGRVDSSVPLTTVRTMDEIVASSVAETSFTMTLLAIAAGVALLLGVVGLYGVTKYIVGQRTTEIGLRLALGARPADIRAMVLRQGIAVALVGVIVGLMGAYALARIMASLLFGVSARDPGTFLATSLLLMAVSAVATYVPAHRATKVDPLVALKCE